MSILSSDQKPRIAITMGDPRGIGPEVVVKALVQPALHSICTPLVIGDLKILGRTSEILSLRPKWVEVQADAPFSPSAGGIPVLSLSHLSFRENPGEISPEESSRASFAYVERATRMALDRQVEAIATAPVSKEAITRAGIPFRGHTEYLAERAGISEFVMMLAGEKLKVALVTTHLPLAEVASSLGEEKIFSAVRLTGRALQEYFALRVPRIAVAGLNPHAGEGGLFGQEEEMISRAVRRAGQSGFLVSGPWPADTLFYRVAQGEFDAVVCMYHDQGLIPLKLLHFDSAVNITLGLPFIRTSVDHGVAYDIAGKGQASSRSLEEAIRLAAEMARRKRRF